MPLIIWGPGVFERKEVVQEFVSSFDIFPSIQGLEGEKVLMVGLYGRDLRRWLKDNDSTEIKKKPFFYYSANGNLRGMRYKEYKLLLKETKTKLYQIEHDPSEEYNLSSKDTFKVRELKTLMTGFKRSPKR